MVTPQLVRAAIEAIWPLKEIASSQPLRGDRNLLYRVEVEYEGRITGHETRLPEIMAIGICRTRYMHDIDELKMIYNIDRDGGVHYCEQIYNLIMKEYLRNLRLIKTFTMKDVHSDLVRPTDQTLGLKNWGIRHGLVDTYLSQRKAEYVNLSKLMRT